MMMLLVIAMMWCGALGLGVAAVAAIRGERDLPER
jgi:hypothetical protein